VRVIPIRADNASPMTGLGTNTYLLPGPSPTLIDAAVDDDGYVSKVAEALEAVQPGVALAQVLITHAHRDHIEGVPAIARRWPGVSFAKLPWPERDAEAGVTFEVLRDDQTIPAGDGTLWVLHTPGHAPDHLSFFDIRTSILFCGDLLVNGGTVTIPASAGGDLAAYLTSLRRCLEFQPRRIYPGHGPPVDNPGALIRAYIGHRVGREQQILEELAAAPGSEDDLLPRVYKDLDPRLNAAALENLRAHLVKLEREGRATRDGDSWTRTERTGRKERN
jgi:glyoxylase-like metal-dependent hydrolase (beta-lactamase superfamily II)